MCRKALFYLSGERFGIVKAYSKVTKSMPFVLGGWQKTLSGTGEKAGSGHHLSRAIPMHDLQPISRLSQALAYFFRNHHGAVLAACATE